MASHGLITLACTAGPKETADRLEVAIKAKGLFIFARIDHAMGATAAGLDLRPTELLIFGNAKGGTPLMRARQTIGIDLPLKALIWQDAEGQTWLTYNDPVWLTERHEIEAEAAATAAALSATLEALAAEATAG